MNTTVLAAIIGGLCVIVAAVLSAIISIESCKLAEILRHKRRLPPGFVILVNGASGVGKTTIGCALIRRFNMTTNISTDLIREALRHDVKKQGEGNNSILLESSYTAYQHLPGDSHNHSSALVVNGFTRQCEIMLGPIIDIVNRIRSKRDPAIIEGVNIIASQVFENLPKDPLSKIFFINLYIQDKKIHCHRIRSRGEKSHESPIVTDRYINNMPAIRDINQFLRDDTHKTAQDREHILCIENSGSIGDTVSQIERRLKRLLKHYEGV
jgi:2-phosphoglycerate kinase